MPCTCILFSEKHSSFPGLCPGRKLQKNSLNSQDWIVHGVSGIPTRVNSTENELGLSVKFDTDVLELYICLARD